MKALAIIIVVVAVTLPTAYFVAVAAAKTFGETTQCSWTARYGCPR